MCVKLVCSKEVNDGGAVHIKYRNNQTLWKMCHASFQMVTIPITYNILFPGGGGWRSSASWRRRRGSPPPGTRSSPSGSSTGSWYSALVVFSLWISKALRKVMFFLAATVKLQEDDNACLWIPTFLVPAFLSTIVAVYFVMVFVFDFVNVIVFAWMLSSTLNLSLSWSIKHL